MFGFKSPTAVNKSPRMVSDHDIVSKIIDLDAVRGHYPEEEYERFYRTYLKYSQNNEKFPSHNYQYEYRVLTILYDFVSEGFDVRKMCGNNAAAIRIFDDGYEKLEDEAFNIASKYGEVVDAVADDNNSNLTACRGFGWVLLHYILDFICRVEGFSCYTDRIPCVFRTADNMYLKYLMDIYYDKENPWFEDIILDTKRAFFEEFKEIVEKEGGAEIKIEKLIEQYLHDVHADGDTTNYEKLKKVLIDDLYWLVVKHK